MHAVNTPSATAAQAQSDTTTPAADENRLRLLAAQIH